MKKLILALLFLSLPLAFAWEEKPMNPQAKKKAVESLTETQRNVTQKADTEAPFKNPYWNNHEAGIYVDVVSGEPLFSSLDKYDSGTGWPSFTCPITHKNIVIKPDNSLGEARNEVRSKHGDSHLGHVFDDGPKGGKRYCMNSASLRFIPVKDLEKEGYKEFLPLFKKDAAKKTETASFAAGCFWGVEDAFRKHKGVVATTVGFMGGHTKNPSYEDVSYKDTGHAETVQVEYDPKVVTYAELLDLFWHIHDPTTMNRQGPDTGSQYRSVIFYYTPEQKKQALASEVELQKSGELDAKIVTEIVPATDFYKAEEYHQHYVEKGGRASCHIRRKKKL